MTEPPALKVDAIFVLIYSVANCASKENKEIYLGIIRAMVIKNLQKLSDDYTGLCHEANSNCENIEVKITGGADECDVSRRKRENRNLKFTVTIPAVE